MMRDEVVRRRAWLTEEQFLDLLGATNLIPGPNSTEMANPHRLAPSPVGRPRRRRRQLHPAGHAHHGQPRVGLRALRDAARGRVAPVGREARHPRDRGAGAVEPGAGRGPHLAAPDRRCRRDRGIAARRERAPDSVRVWCPGRGPQTRAGPGRRAGSGRPALAARRGRRRGSSRRSACPGFSGCS